MLYNINLANYQPHYFSDEISMDTGIPILTNSAQQTSVAIKLIF